MPETIEVPLDLTRRLSLKLTPSGVGDGVEGILHVEQWPVILDYRFESDAEELVAFSHELEELHTSLEGQIEYPKQGSFQITLLVSDRRRGQIAIRVWLRLPTEMMEPQGAGDPRLIFEGFTMDQSYLPGVVRSFQEFVRDTGLAKRLEIVEVDLSGVRTIGALHRTLADALGFPAFYGHNWDAFWDAITGLVRMPRRLVLRGWKTVETYLPDDAAIMLEQLQKMNRQYPPKCEVVLAASGTSRAGDAPVT